MGLQALVWVTRKELKVLGFGRRWLLGGMNRAAEPVAVMEDCILLAVAYVLKVDDEH